MELGRAEVDEEVEKVDHAPWGKQLGCSRTMMLDCDCDTAVDQFKYIFKLGK